MSTSSWVEYGIPYPTRSFATPPGRAPKYPWAHMDVGGSFLIHKEDLPPSGVNAIKSLCVNTSKKMKMTFKCRVVEHGDVRVWRLE